MTETKERQIAEVTIKVSMPVGETWNNRQRMEHILRGIRLRKDELEIKPALSVSDCVLHGVE